VGAPVVGNVVNVKWSYKITSPCTSGFTTPIDTGANLNITCPEYTVGTFVVKASVTVQNGYMSALQEVLGTFVILPPDDILLPQPPNNSATIALGVGAPGQTTVFRFPVLCSGKTVGYLSGTAKENLTSVML